MKKMVIVFSVLCLVFGQLVGFGKDGSRKRHTGRNVAIGAAVAGGVTAFIGIMTNREQEQPHLRKQMDRRDVERRSNYPDNRPPIRQDPDQEYFGRSQSLTPIGEHERVIRRKPGDPHPDDFADYRPTLTLQITTEGNGVWYTGADREQFISYLESMFSERYQLVQSYNSPDLHNNQGETEFSNSRWTKNATNRKTIGNMQNADYIAYVIVNLTQRSEDYGHLNGGWHVQGRVDQLVTKAHVTIKITAVNNRAILEHGQGNASGSATRFADVYVLGQRAGRSSYSENEAARNAAIEALRKAWRDMRKM